MRIVKAGPQEAFVVAALTLQAAIAIDGAREEGFLDRAAGHWLRHHEQLPTWFAEHDGAHAGLLQAAHPPETTWPGQASGTRGRLWIHTMYVHADHRRRGVGAALLAACEGWAQGAGVGMIRLHCNPGAEDFYDATGYGPAEGIRQKQLDPLR